MWRLFFVAVFGCVTQLAEASEGDNYALDTLSREISPRGRVSCPAVETRPYRGTTIRYQKAARVYVGFIPRLERFEEVVRATAIEIYGRAPMMIVHAGVFNCRRISGWPNLISEHDIVNGIDIEGFDSGGKRPFTVRLGRDWNAKGTREKHARFLRVLAQRLIDRQDIFRVLLGPSYVGHQSHFHFDCSPWRLVDIFG